MSGHVSVQLNLGSNGIDKGYNFVLEEIKTAQSPNMAILEGKSSQSSQHWINSSFLSGSSQSADFGWSLR